MKKILQNILLLLLVVCVMTSGYALHSGNVTDELMLRNITLNQGPDTGIFPIKTQDQVEIRVYPNPATEYFSISEIDHLKEIVVFNLVGREVKRFKATYQGKYDISDLASGFYLVRLVGDHERALKTIRLSKR